MQILTSADSANMNTLYTLLNIKIEISDHENIGIGNSIMVIAYTDMQILTIIGFSVMAALIKGFRIQSHTPDLPAHIFMKRGENEPKKGIHTCGPLYINKSSGLLLYRHAAHDGVGFLCCCFFLNIFNFLV